MFLSIGFLYMYMYLLILFFFFYAGHASRTRDHQVEARIAVITTVRTWPPDLARV